MKIESGIHTEATSAGCKPRLNSFSAGPIDA